MTSLVTRRQSCGSRPPRVVISSRHNTKDGNVTHYEVPSPSTLGTPEVEAPDVDSPDVESPDGDPSDPLTITSALSGTLSPCLQPVTPPVIDGRNDCVLQIGKYLLVSQLDDNVYKAVDIHTNQEKVCKVFTQDNYRSKIAAYCRLHGTTSVVEINEIIQGDRFVYVFFDKHYGDLHSYVRSKRRLREEEAVTLFQQIAEAVAQCHECGVIIRDLKLRKFVFTDVERTKIQLEGIEDSHLLDDESDDTLRDKQGCPAYVSPEILERAQLGYSGKASDQWSSGVMLYTMLIGRYPFQESEPTKLFEKIKLGKFSIPGVASAKAKCLIRNLLRKEASDRLTSHEVLQHPWLKVSTSYLVTNTNMSLDCQRDADDSVVPCSFLF